MLSAFGTLVTPARLDLARGGLCRLSELNWEDVDPLIDDMFEEGKAALIEAGLPEDFWSKDTRLMRYTVQKWQEGMQNG